MKILAIEKYEFLSTVIFTGSKKKLSFSKYRVASNFFNCELRVTSSLGNRYFDFLDNSSGVILATYKETRNDK